MPGQAIVQGSSDLWVESGAQAERSLNTSWVLDQAFNSTGGFATNAGPSTATAFLSTGDGSSGTGNAYYALLRKLRVVHTGGTAYCRVLTAAYSTTTLQTTVTVGDFQSGTTSLSTTAITTVAASPFYYGSSGYAPDEAGLRNTGDMMYRDSTGVTRLTIGTSGQAIYGGTVPQWATATAPGTVQLAAVALTTDAATIDITGISTAYAHLLLVGQIRLDTAGGQNLRMRFNADTGTNYDYQGHGVLNGADFFEGNATQAFAIMGIVGGATFGSPLEVWIPNYASTSLNKTAHCHMSAVRVNPPTSGDIYVTDDAAYWRSAASINQITFSLAAQSFGTNTRLNLYGFTS